MKLLLPAEWGKIKVIVRVMLEHELPTRTGTKSALDRLEATLAALNGSSYKGVGFTPAKGAGLKLGSFVLRKDGNRLQADAYEDSKNPDTLRLTLDRIDSEHTRQAKGIGARQMLTLFDIADAAGIERIDVTCASIGRYAHASYGVYALPDDWGKLQTQLRRALQSYRTEPPRGTELRAGRDAQAARVAAAIDNCGGRLGEIVNVARVKTIGTPDDRQLGKLLFLDSRVRNYDGCWLPEDRAAFRADVHKRYGITASLATSEANNNPAIGPQRTGNAQQRRLLGFRLRR